MCQEAKYAYQSSLFIPACNFNHYNYLEKKMGVSETKELVAIYQAGKCAGVTQVQYKYLTPLTFSYLGTSLNIK